MDAVEKAQSGHPGMPMGMADIATVLWTDFLKFNPKDPTWPDRDRFILSNGHGSMLQYSLAYLTGYKAMTLDQIKNFRQLGSLTPGHPELHHEIGVETTTGPLAQGLANGVGMALAERIMNAHFGDELVNHHTYVFVGDGCLMEGLSQEAISFAGHMGLGKLIVIFDDNNISIDGPTCLSTSEDHIKRFDACGWHTQSIDGHNHQEIFDAISAAKDDPRPSLIAARTVIGFGAPTKSGKAEVHGSPLGDTEIQGTRSNFAWDSTPFEVPQEIIDLWRKVPERATPLYKSWKDHWNTTTQDIRDEFSRRLEGKVPTSAVKALQDLADQYILQQPTKATRQISGDVLNTIQGLMSELIGGSADLTPSNNTKTKESAVITAEDFSGSYVHYGIREHAMASIMNGLALHGGVLPYGGTFLTFTDYCRPAIRLAALMQQRVIYVMTHDSIGLGEDGPTHQPIEHLASLRAIPNLNVFRPCDPVEVAECWLLALESNSSPSILALTRQSVPCLRTPGDTAYENHSSLGAYILKAASATECLVITATGSEVSLALEVREILEAKGHPTRVVSMPCREVFEQQTVNYQNRIIPRDCQRFVIEAASPFGWDRYATSPQHIFGLSTFGASAPYKELYAHFELTPASISKKILHLLKP